MWSTSPLLPLSLLISFCLLHWFVELLFRSKGPHWWQFMQTAILMSSYVFLGKCEMTAKTRTLWSRSHWLMNPNTLTCTLPTARRRSGTLWCPHHAIFLLLLWFTGLSGFPLVFQIPKRFNLRLYKKIKLLEIFENTAMVYYKCTFLCANVPDIFPQYNFLCFDRKSKGPNSLLSL